MSVWDGVEEDTGETPESVAGQFQELPATSLGFVQGGEDGGLMGMLVQAAQSIQRDPAKLIERAKFVGSLLAKKGFYQFPMGGENIEGESIGLAQALAQEWGGILYQVRIINIEKRADGGQTVHLRASVGDLKSLVCANLDQVVAVAAPPGKFAKKPDQVERWNMMQVQNASSRIVRNAILRVLPKWYVQPALDAAKAAVSHAILGKKPIQEVRAEAIEHLGKFGCRKEELEAYVGQVSDLWAVPQVSELLTLFHALKSGAQSVEAWRAGLPAKAEANAAAQGAPQADPSGTTRRATLGLPAQSSSVPLDLGAPPKKEEPVARPSTAGGNAAADIVNRHKRNGGGAQPQGREPGDDGP